MKSQNLIFDSQNLAHSQNLTREFIAESAFFVIWLLRYARKSYGLSVAKYLKKIEILRFALSASLRMTKLAQNLTREFFADLRFAESRAFSQNLTKIRG